MDKLIESLSPNERKIIPHLDESVNNICKKTNMDKVSVLRALEYLQNKKIIEMETTKEKIVDIGVNGALYKKKGLPERRFLNTLEKERMMSFQDLQKAASLSPDEFKAALGALKKKAMIGLDDGKIILSANSMEIAKKSLEEQLIEKLPLSFDKLEPEQHFALASLQKRKDIVEIIEKKTISITTTQLGKDVIKKGVSQIELIEQITPALLKSEKNWKGKKYRRYDVEGSVPHITGGKRHFVNQSADYIRKIWTDLGFDETTGNIIQQSFWNFDALFTAQDHPVREMQDTFFIDKKEDLPDKRIVEKVKIAHEQGVDGSKGWQYKWEEEKAKQMVLRTHTTGLSAQVLEKLNPKTDLPVKMFALGKAFRNETVDWCHGYEFYQTEGIVIDKDANFRHLLGYLKQFYKKMGFDKVRFRPAYFPYTEPSVEVDVWHEGRGVWLELGGAGIFRPEVSITLLGENIPILAWGQGVDRIIMDYYKIKDLRELYKNDIDQLRKIKFWTKN